MSAGLMGVGRSALMAAYAQLQTSGHNIANAATPGYSRQEVVNKTAGADFTGAGYIGRGVDVGEVRRRYEDTELWWAHDDERREHGRRIAAAYQAR